MRKKTGPPVVLVATVFSPATRVTAHAEFTQAARLVLSCKTQPTVVALALVLTGTPSSVQFTKA